MNPGARKRGTEDVEEVRLEGPSAGVGRQARVELCGDRIVKGKKVGGFAVAFDRFNNGGSFAAAGAGIDQERIHALAKGKEDGLLMWRPFALGRSGWRRSWAEGLVEFDRRLSHFV